MISSVRVIGNPRAAAREAPPPDALASDGFEAAYREISGWPGYRPTPIHNLKGLAAELGLGKILYKDEGPRFGLGSFKPLGGAYAVARVLARELAKRGIAVNATAADLLAGRHAEAVRGITITSATDGNHGRSVAWGARMFGCRAVIFIHQTVSEGRKAAIERYGAEVIRVPGGYDDSVRHAFAEAERRGWHVVQDTATADYRTVPADISHGYGVIAGEVVAQVSEPPTHVLVQAGVGGAASAVCARFWQLWGTSRPAFLVLEPAKAACVAASLAAGKRVEVTGDLETVMAGLSCGVVSELAWEVLATGADGAVVIDDGLALEGMRRLAFPLPGDPPIVGGECSGGAVGALIGLSREPSLMAQIGFGKSSSVLLIGTEGATDPVIYKEIVGKAPEEILA
ncbi:MAG: diaminopropionate ammonia-lyase [Hyphomicrobiaceae bacterium]|nr:MAG: diaminopropionate ammonia-lyase [Hyphomicrobiaceae bacterium]